MSVQLLCALALLGRKSHRDNGVPTTPYATDVIPISRGQAVARTYEDVPQAYLPQPHDGHTIRYPRCIFDHDR
jgi:hypothetical protein